MQCFIMTDELRTHNWEAIHIISYWPGRFVHRHYEYGRNVFGINHRMPKVGHCGALQVHFLVTCLFDAILTECIVDKFNS